MKDKIKKIYIFIKEKMYKYFSTNVLFTTFLICSIIIGLIVRILTVGGFLSLKPLLTDLTILLIIGSFGYLIKPKRQFIYFFLWLLLFTFLGIANTLYYEFYHSFISINLLSTLKMVGDVEESVTTKLKIGQFIYIIFPIILFYVNSRLKKKKYYFEIEKIEKGKRMFFTTALVGFVIFLLTNLTLTNSEVSRFVKMWNREFVVQRFGLYIYTANDIIQSIEPKLHSLFGYDEAYKDFREFYEEKALETKKDNKYTNIFKGKNVLFIHAESIQNFLIGLKINGQEITPNLNRLSEQGIYFSKFYPQISVGTSSDTEFTLSTGLMPSSSGTVFVSYADRKYIGMPKYFDDLGYYSFSMHANNADYWNRKVMHKSLGYEKFYAKSYYNTNEDNTRGLGLTDKSFFEQIIPILSDIKANKSPFMGTIITLSNHSPFFDEKGDYSDFDITMHYTNELGESLIAPYLTDTEIGSYIRSSHYADEALGELFTRLKDAGILDNTIIMLYGDHDAKLSKKDMNLLYNYDYLTNMVKTIDDPTYINLENYGYELLKNAPLILWSNEKNYKLNVKDVMGMYDMLPTIANMFGIKTQDYELGHDIFSNSEKIVIFPNGNFLTNKVYYNNLKDDYITFGSDPIESDYILRLKEYTEKRLEISNSIIVYDLIRKNEESIGN
jgi:phosphoglycerol transferase MdoB-like AlkP superfamily enzyme